jgi:hypothetical protein
MGYEIEGEEGEETRKEGSAAHILVKIIQSSLIAWV